MARRIPFWLRNVFKLYLQYLLSGLAAIPAGLLTYALVRAGITEAVALLASAAIGLVVAASVWQWLDKRLLIEHLLVPADTLALMTFNWEFQSAGGSGCLAGTMLVMATYVATPPTVEYRSMDQASRVGTATRIQVPSRRE